MSPKICLACKHFHFYGGARGYSSWKPGGDMEVSCDKKHWNAWEESAEQFFKDNLRAETCPDYEISELAIKHGWTK